MDKQKDSHGVTISGYLMGFILAVLLTLLSFIPVMKDLFHNWTVSSKILYLLGLALIQIFVQVFYFLHLQEGPDAKWNIGTFAFGVVCVTIIIGGTWWAIQHLNYNMMGGSGRIVTPPLLNQTVTNSVVVAPVANSPVLFVKPDHASVTEVHAQPVKSGVADPTQKTIAVPVKTLPADPGPSIPDNHTIVQTKTTIQTTTTVAGDVKKSLTSHEQITVAPAPEAGVAAAVSHKDVTTESTDKIMTQQVGPVKGALENTKPGSEPVKHKEAANLHSSVSPGITQPTKMANRMKQENIGGSEKTNASVSDLHSEAVTVAK